MIIGRSEPLDYKSVFETIVNTLADYLVKNNIKTIKVGWVEPNKNNKTEWVDTSPQPSPQG